MPLFSERFITEYSQMNVLKAFPNVIFLKAERRKGILASTAIDINFLKLVFLDNLLYFPFDCIRLWIIM